MPTKNKALDELLNVDRLFGITDEPETKSSGGTKEIEISSIADFPNHPFKVKLDEEMDKLVENVKLMGVISPAVVRPMPDGSYQMISGHRRKKACELAEIKTIPCIVREMDDDQAVIMMCDANLQRERILPSERAASYKMRLEAVKRQGKRSDLTSTPLVSKSRSNEEVGEISGDSREQVRRYIRLTELIPEILDKVDEGKIAFRPAVELSYLSADEQRDLYELMDSELATPSLAQAIALKQMSQSGTLTPEAMFDLIKEQKPNQAPKLSFKHDEVNEFFPKNYTEQQRHDIVIDLLKKWAQNRKREMER